MVRYLLAMLILVATLPFATGFAQPIGPPISPQQQFDAQPRPRTQLPPVYVPPVGDSAITYGGPPVVAPPPGPSRGRAAECRHQAALERVPRSQQGAYVRNCMMN